MVVLLLLFLSSGALLAVLSIPLIKGKISPNGLYGFRVRKTLENPGIWYPVNAYSGKWLLVLGLVLVIAAGGLFLIPDISIDIYSYANLAIWGIVFTIALLDSIRFMNTL
jgi:hypothetical protein